MIPDPGEIARYLLGETTRARAEEIEALAARDPRVREEIELQRRMLRDLEAAPPELASLDLVGGVREAIARTPVSPARPRWWGLAAGAIAAAALVAILLPARRDPDEVRARGGDTTFPAEERWVGIQLFRASGDQVKGRATTTIAAGEGLLVAYLNGGPAPFTHLMVFAVDGKGRTFWLYPEHAAEGRDPASIPIERGDAPIELPDRVVHDFARGPLAVYGLFTRAPIPVSRVEAEVVRTPFDAKHPRPLAIPGAAQHVIPLVVE